ncbi:hypothetical protein [Thiococcus pfennigii]|uniref:hypothetical protein n=1 Tax=Thiococcus pfennigii TaxID=1057 RepID=UPI001903A714|nr:hypothetical protein [Thiococcus pfennigii]MBK1702643.1 hypothetical protein [Thiococcus pfennigii]MBK1730675.1 hypothetical protein [Thiococcus pfennigii]
MIEIESHPPRDTRAAGWVRTREYPPEYRRATPWSIDVLTVGKRGCTGGGFVKVTSIERF